MSRKVAAGQVRRSTLRGERLHLVLGPSAPATGVGEPMWACVDLLGDGQEGRVFDDWLRAFSEPLA